MEEDLGCNAGLLTATIGCLVAAAPAQAQVVLFVNGDPITNFDIEQRGKLVQLTLHKTVGREELSTPIHI